MQKLREQNSTKYQKNNIRRQIFISPVMKKPRFQIQNQGLLLGYDFYLACIILY